VDKYARDLERHVTAAANWNGLFLEYNDATMKPLLTKDVSKNSYILFFEKQSHLEPKTIQEPAVQKLPNTLPMTSNPDVQTRPSDAMSTGTLPYFTCVLTFA
jgi:hypothetical protein